MLQKVKTEHKVQIKPEKYESIELRPAKSCLRNEAGHMEIDSVIGKANDKKALATMIDMHTGIFSARLYDRDAASFLIATKENLKTYSRHWKTITADNGSENAKLGKLLSQGRIFNCHAYCSWEKGSIENIHRLVRRVFPKGMSMNDLTDAVVQEMVKFVNEYYRPRYNLGDTKISELRIGI